MGRTKWRAKAELDAEAAEAEAKRGREQQVHEAARQAYAGLQEISQMLPKDSVEQKAIHRINDVVKGLIRLTVKELL